VDGTLVETSSGSWTLSGANDQPVEIGRYRDTHNNVTNYFTGDIDDVRVYKSALGAGDVTALYQKQPLAASPLENIVFLNLKFDGSNFDYANPTGPGQGMIYFSKASNLVVANNEFARGSTGIRLSGGSNNTISGNALTDMALGGIFCDGITDSVITNNRVRNTAQYFADPGANIRIDSVTDVVVSHNNLSTSKRHGIRMRASTGVTIEYNEVTDMNTDSQDTGAIYWGYSDDNIVDHNRVHHSGDSFGQQHAFYVEDGSDRTVITNNIAFEIGNAPSNGLTATINVKGVANLIQNNIFDFTRSHAGLRTFEILANAPANNEKVLDNIFYSGSTSTNSTTFYDFQSYNSNRIDQSDRNVFRKTASGSNVFENIPGDDTLTNWKTLRSNRYDQNSVTTAPGFVDAANHNYNFVSGPPLSFIPIDTSWIGLLPEFIYPATAAQWVLSGNAADITLGGNDGTNNGGTYVANRFTTASSALSLNGSSNYVNVPDNAALDFGDPAKPFTIVAWIKTSAGSAGGIVAKARDTNTPNMDYRFQMLANGTIQLMRWNQAAGVTDVVTTTATVNNGAWHHVAFVNEGASSHKLYIDGVLAATSNTTWVHDNTNTEPVRIGRDRNGSASDTYFNGVIDDVAIIQAALTLNDILDLNHLPHP
jgi:parallel beta-helix repeat protein